MARCNEWLYSKLSSPWSFWSLTFIIEWTASESLPTPFKFDNCWVLHEGFYDLVQARWQSTVKGDPLYVLCKKLKYLKLSLRIWAEGCSDLKEQVLDAKVKLSEVQLKLQDLPFDQNLISLEKLYREDYIRWKNMEEMDLRQKYKTEWTALWWQLHQILP